MQMTSTVLFSVGALVLSVIAAGWDIAVASVELHDLFERGGAGGVKVRSGEFDIAQTR